MRKRFRYVVIGRGLTGSAAARHLANRSDGVALIGPGEPRDRKTHKGVFASHYDEGRITRTIDPDPVWARLARLSIERYREIEKATGISFYGEVGSLLTGPGVGSADTYVADTLAAAETAGVSALHLDREAMAARFSWFSFPTATEGVFEEKGAGYISPRKLVLAQSELAERAGAEIINCAVNAVRLVDGHVAIGTSEGEIVEADAVLVATGGFSIQKNLLPHPVELTVYGRTVVLFEVSEADARGLSAMPSMINKAEHARDDTYMLPPIRYPDGRYYLKIGGDPVDLRLEGHQLGGWFRSDGNPAAIEHLKARMKSLVPGLEPLSISSASCVTTFTRSGYPAIGWLEPGRLGIMAGGCGMAAKSSDEIGRLGAELLYEGEIASRSYDADFSPVQAVV